MTDFSADNLRALAARLEAPSYWISGSSEGHDGENDAPREAAAAILAMAEEREALDGRPDIQGDPKAKIMGYNDLHEDAVALGYPSILEALERMREAGNRLAFAAGALNIATDSAEHLTGERGNVLDAMKGWESALGEEKAS